MSEVLSHKADSHVHKVQSTESQSFPGTGSYSALLSTRRQHGYKGGQYTETSRLSINNATNLLLLNNFFNKVSDTFNTILLAQSFNDSLHFVVSICIYLFISSLLNDASSVTLTIVSRFACSNN
jgi:hypothetical protein